MSEWVDHDGRSRPSDETWRVSARTRNGTKSEPHPPKHWPDEQWSWANRSPSKSDIVEYMIHEEPKPEPQEPQPPQPVDEAYRNLMLAINAFEADRGVMLRTLRIERLIGGHIARIEVDCDLVARRVGE